MKTKGQALVEMAIVLLLLFLLVFGIFQFGWLMYIKNTLNNAARAGVRQAVVTSSLVDTTYDYSGFNTRSTTDLVQQKIYDSLYYVTLSDVRAVVDVVGKSGTTAATSGDTVTVTVTLRNVPSFVSGLITVASTLTGTASMRYE